MFRLSLLILFSAFVSLHPPEISKADLLGKFDPSTHPDFARIDSQYSRKKDLYMRQEAYEAFALLHAEAKRCNIQLHIISATRNFEAQKAIWNRKWQKYKTDSLSDADCVQKIMLYSSMPGTSRHHWGTDIDLNNLEDAYFNQGEGLKVYEWLKDFAGGYGFVQCYDAKKNGRSGYEEEKWHWSYLPLSEAFLNAYNAQIKYSDINGFSGADSAESLDIFGRYVNGISTSGQGKKP